MNKKNNWLAVSLFLACVGMLQASPQDSIAFFKNEKWANILAMAEKQQKTIFVDVYTTWCGPCKAMDKKAFKDAEVSAYFNAQFISVKLDAEKGEGIELSKQYKVGSFPTYLFINAKGELLATFGGAMSPAKFLEKAKAIQNDITNIAPYHKDYQAGKREPAFLAAYTRLLHDSGQPYTAVFEEYWQARGKPQTPSQEDLDLIMRLISEHRDRIDYKSTLFQTYLTHIENFKQVYGKDSIDYITSSKIRDNIRIYTNRKDEKSFEELLVLDAEHTPHKGKGINIQLNNYRQEFYKATENWEKYFPITLEANKDFESRHSLGQIALMDSIIKMAMKQMKEEVPIDMPDMREITVMLLCGDAWIFHDHTDNLAYLKEAARWSEHATKVLANYKTLITHAHLLAKNKKKKEALKMAREGLTLANKALENAKEDEEKEDINKLKDKAIALIKKLEK